MVIYEVNADINRDIADDFAAWLAPHIDELLEIDGFTAAHWFEREDDHTDSTVAWTVQYHVTSMQALDDYLEHHAARLRGDGLDKFGDNFKTSRRVLSLRMSK